MSKVWHISDTHLSFDKDWIPMKPMNLRKWAIGAWTYTGYLDRIAKFGKEVIHTSDYVCITGDIVHDMKEPYVAQSLRWLRHHINGTIIVCRGNHDKYWDVGRMRQHIADLPSFYILDEGEIQTIGPYTIGCFSNHNDKTQDFNSVDGRYLEMALNTVKQAKLKQRTPIMMSHYPVNIKAAEAIGSTGLKAYMSGHIHCTDANESGPDHPLNWDWYNKSAAQTDDKTINGCFFSTATTDVVQARHKQSFKEMNVLEQSSVDDRDLSKHKVKAINTFKCKESLVSKFEKQDPFNTNNTLTGFICREKGDMQGSLYITHVNGIATLPQLIYGTPKLKYPYKNTSSRDFMDLPKYHKIFLAEKWNGMNVLMYKYEDHTGKEYLTAKSKGTPFLTDSEIGNFLSLTKEVLKRNDLDVCKHLSALFDNNKYIMDPNLQSISFELCGFKEPHLVKYDFDIKLKPLFSTYKDGSIRPLEYTPLNWEHVSEEEVKKNLTYFQHRDHIANQTYRAKVGLPHKYEYEHFAVEGKVIYFVDVNGWVIDRTMYKLKPQDIEEVHWQTFGKDMHGKVREAIHKIKTEHGVINEETIRQELDMGPKEWGKFGKAVMQHVKSGEANTAEVLILCGLPGSGKTTIAKILENHGYLRINQDDLGSRKACRKLMDLALKDNKSVVIDRCNFDVNQRKSWIDLAYENGVSNIRCVWLDTPAEVCLARASIRTEHPTISSAEEAGKAITAIDRLFNPPSIEEGFMQVLHLHEPNISADALADKIRNTNEM